MAEEARAQSFWSTIPGCMTAMAGIITAVTGLILAIHQITKSDHPPAPDAPAVTASPIAPKASASVPASVPSKPVSENSFTDTPALPANTCPTVQGMFWMQYPNIWYGPFGGGDGIGYSSGGGFYVWDSAYGRQLPYPDPYGQIQRNTWTPLQQSRFSVCVDGSNNVFGLYR